MERPGEWEVLTGVEYHLHPSGDARFPGHFTVKGCRASDEYGDGYSRGAEAGADIILNTLKKAGVKIPAVW